MRRESVAEGVSLRGIRRMRREASVDEAWDKVFTLWGRNNVGVSELTFWVVEKWLLGRQKRLLGRRKLIQFRLSSFDEEGGRREGGRPPRILQ